MLSTHKMYKIVPFKLINMFLQLIQSTSTFNMILQISTILIFNVQTYSDK